MSYKKLNNYLGWFVFLIATIVYFITIEDTVSLWDCGEYITAAYKLEVGHPPGAPFFMVLGRMFSFFANETDVAVWINRLSALSSSFTILFMFWSITMFAKKLAFKGKEILSRGDEIAILGAGLVGALAYTFTESFWFSAVEGEVYAMSSMFTALIFWAALKWDEEMARQANSLDSARNFSPDRWLILIMFLLGLAIGVHLLGILVVPAIVYIIYFRYGKISNGLGYILIGIIGVALILALSGASSFGNFIGMIFFGGLIFAVGYGLFILSKHSKVAAFIFIGLSGIIVLYFIQNSVISGSVSMASSFEVTFRNTFGLPFYSGTVFFFALLFGGCIFLLRFSRKKNIPVLYNSVLGLIMLFIGYGAFAVIVIRSNANTPLDENDPENLVTLKAYLNREQYGSAPILYGPYWNSQAESRENNGDLSPFYLRRFVVEKDGENTKAFKDEARALKYAKTEGGEVVEKYFETNSKIRTGGDQKFTQNTFFPRMYYGAEDVKVKGYKKWSGYDPSEDKGTEIGRDGNRLPTFGENLYYFFNYQMNFMYTRYFLWNFAGRQNDIQNHEGDQMRGNWLSGYNFIDESRLGNQTDHATYYTSSNKSNNTFFYLPLILALIGMVFHFYKAPKDAFVILLLFLFTGVAINIYLNPRPYEPRERDYAYAGSFYFFALWIGMGVYALYSAFKTFTKKEWKGIAIIGGLVLLFMMMLDSGSLMGMPLTLSWLTILLIAGAAIYLMTLLRKIIKSEVQGATIAILLGLFVPIVLGLQGWDDHDRSGKFSARDLAYNYLEPCAKNAILFTNGDNDTFPLWYLQEVEGKRTDVRVANLSLMQTDWYTLQMMMKAYDSDPLPIKFTEDQIQMYSGTTDQVIFIDLTTLYSNGMDRDVIEKIIELRVKYNPDVVKTSVASFEMQVAPILGQIKSRDTKAQSRLAALSSVLTNSGNSKSLSNNISAKYLAGFEVLSGLQNGTYTLDQEMGKAFLSILTKFEEPWEAIDIKAAMEFVRDDKNVLENNGNTYHFFPTKVFSMKVNKQNVLKSGLLAKTATVDDIDDVVKISFAARQGIPAVQLLSREEVMMMDAIGNNDWKRAIYFSSPGGSSVSKALYYSGYIRQLGLTYSFVPKSTNQERFDKDLMYNNLMNVYKFDGLNNPNVLTDYYTRRSTSQYRNMYLVLAGTYADLYSNYDNMKSSYDRNIEMAKTQGNNEMVKTFETEKKKLGDKETMKKRALALIDKSLKVMPNNVVLDYGEPANQGRAYTNGGERYGDGYLQDYVELLYRLGAKGKAEKLGLEIAKQLESVVDYFTYSDPIIAGMNVNNIDLFAAIDNYFTLTQAANNEEGNPDGALAKRTSAKLQQWFNTTFPSMLSALKERAVDNGENVKEGRNMEIYSSYYFNLKNGLDAIGIEYGLIQPPAAPQQQGAPMPINMPGVMPQ